MSLFPRTGASASEHTAAGDNGKVSLGSADAVLDVRGPRLAPPNACAACRHLIQEASESAVLVQVDVLNHPLAAVALTALRDETTPRTAFRAALHDLALMLVYEATRELPTAPVPVRTPLARTTGAKLAAEPVVVPVLRAGLGMLPAAHALVPDAVSAFIGLARDEETFAPTVYLESVPADLTGRPVLLLDPMLATGGSALHALRLLAGRGGRGIVVVAVVAAPEGVAALDASGLDVRLVTATIDDGLNDAAYIVPGLGDAGDRLFGAV